MAHHDGEANQNFRNSLFRDLQYKEEISAVGYFIHSQNSLSAEHTFLPCMYTSGALGEPCRQRKGSLLYWTGTSHWGYALI